MRLFVGSALIQNVTKAFQEGMAGMKQGPRSKSVCRSG